MKPVMAETKADTDQRPDRDRQDMDIETDGDDAADQEAGEDRSGGIVRSKQVIVRPVVNAVRILKYLSESGQPRRAAQVAKDLSINTSTCFNILRTLVAEEVLDFDPLSKSYTIGFGIVKIAERVMSEGERVSVARPHLKEFAERFGVTVTLWRRIGGDRIAQVAVEYCTRDTRIQVSPGRRGPMLMGATGRLLATKLGLSRAEVEQAFTAIRWAQPLDFAQYWSEAETAAKRGWALDDGYFYGGTTNIAAAVLDPSGAFAFSIVATMFRGQYDDAVIARMGDELRSLGQRLTSLLY